MFDFFDHDAMEHINNNRHGRLYGEYDDSLDDAAQDDYDAQDVFSHDDSSANEPYTHIYGDNFAGPDGNADILLNYDDPLLHASEYHPAEFVFEDDITWDTGHVMMHGDMYDIGADGGIIPNVSSVDDLYGVENGVLINSGGLESMIQMGQIEGTEHIESENIHRSEAAKQDFLFSHGYSEIPEGYEIHHIIPLSEGGSDTPENMVLVSEAEHQQITAAHREFYKW